MRRPFAVFVVAIKMKLIAAVTKPHDVHVPIGLHGGKLNCGETAVDVLRRECEEEGWDIQINKNSKPFHVQQVDTGVNIGTKLVHWYLAVNTIIRTEYVESNRGILPFFATYDTILNSGYGNCCIQKLRLKLT